MPVIVHTGLGAPWSMPSLCIPQARRDPSLAIVLAHAGYAVYPAEPYVAATATGCSDICPEPPWCPIEQVQMFIRRLGADLVMFGSDLSENVPLDPMKALIGPPSWGGDDSDRFCLSDTAPAGGPLTSHGTGPLVHGADARLRP